MQTVVTAFRLLEELAVRQPVGVSEFARAMGMPKSTTHRFLKALEKAGWVRPAIGEPTRWVMTARPLIVAQHVASDLGIRELSVPVMEKLRDTTSEAVHLAVRDGNEIVVIESVESPQAVRIYWPPGQHSPVHATANGKALLAFSTSEQRRSLLPAELVAFTDHTLITKSDLEEELALVRKRGWALSDGELRDDIGSVAAPIFGPGGRTVASLSIFFPRHRMPDDGGAGLGSLVKEAAMTISRELPGTRS